MSSHWNWAERVVKEHNENKPFAPENGQPLKFKIGDQVIYTNRAGVEFRYRIHGLYQPSPIDAMYATGSRYYVDSSSPWFPINESALRLDEPGHSDWGNF